MSVMSIYDAAKLLDHQEFLQPVWEPVHAQLVAEITQMRDEGEELDILPFYASFAWRRNFKIHCELTIRSQHRQRAEKEKAAAEPHYEDQWPPYVRDLGTLRDFIHRHSITQIEQDWAGLQHGDLGEPMIDRNPVPDWPDRKFRIQRALTKFSELGPQRRREIPFEMRLAALEHENVQIKARLREIESLFKLTGNTDAEKSVSVN